MAQNVMSVAGLGEVLSHTRNSVRTFDVQGLYLDRRQIPGERAASGL